MALYTKKWLVVLAIEKVLYLGQHQRRRACPYASDDRSGGPKKLIQERLGRPTVDCLHFACQDFKLSFTLSLRF